MQHVVLAGRQRDNSSAPVIRVADLTVADVDCRQRYAGFGILTEHEDAILARLMQTHDDSVLSHRCQITLLLSERASNEVLDFWNRAAANQDRTKSRNGDRAVVPYGQRIPQRRRTISVEL